MIIDYFTNEIINRLYVNKNKRNSRKLFEKTRWTLAPLLSNKDNLVRIDKLEIIREIKSLDFPPIAPSANAISYSTTLPGIKSSAPGKSLKANRGPRKGVAGSRKVSVKLPLVPISGPKPNANTNTNTNTNTNASSNTNPRLKAKKKSLDFPLLAITGASQESFSDSASQSFVLDNNTLSNPLNYASTLLNLNATRSIGALANAEKSFNSNSTLQAISTATSKYQHVYSKIAMSRHQRKKGDTGPNLTEMDGIKGLERTAITIRLTRAILIRNQHLLQQRLKREAIESKTKKKKKKQKLLLPFKPTDRYILNNYTDTDAEKDTRAVKKSHALLRPLIYDDKSLKNWKIYNDIKSMDYRASIKFQQDKLEQLIDIFMEKNLAFNEMTLENALVCLDDFAKPLLEITHEEEPVENILPELLSYRLSISKQTQIKDNFLLGQDAREIRKILFEDFKSRVSRATD